MRTLNYLVILLILLLELSLQVLQDEQTTKRRHPAFVHLLSHEIFLWWYLTPDSFLQLLGLEEIHPGEKGCSGISEWKRGEHQR